MDWKHSAGRAARQEIGESAFHDAANDGRATPVARIMEMDPNAFASA
jgi:hypothetical protein